MRWLKQAAIAFHGLLRDFDQPRPAAAVPSRHRVSRGFADRRSWCIACPGAVMDELGANRSSPWSWRRRPWSVPFRWSRCSSTAAEASAASRPCHWPWPAVSNNWQGKCLAAVRAADWRGGSRGGRQQYDQQHDVLAVPVPCRAAHRGRSDLDCRPAGSRWRCGEYDLRSQCGRRFGGGRVAGARGLDLAKDPDPLCLLRGC
jgi:hypothetical protein